jgi:hypothetical protein
MSTARKSRDADGLSDFDKAVKFGSGMRTEGNFVYMTEFEDNFRVTCWGLDCHYAPVNAHERMLVRRVAELQWALARVAATEARIVERHLERMHKSGVSADGARGAAFRLIVSRCADELGMLQKHEVLVARAFRKAVNHVEEVQALRLAKERKSQVVTAGGAKPPKLRQRTSRRAMDLTGEELLAFATACLTLGEIREREEYKQKAGK